MAWTPNRRRQWQAARVAGRQESELLGQRQHAGGGGGPPAPHLPPRAADRGEGARLLTVPPSQQLSQVPEAAPAACTAARGTGGGGWGGGRRWRWWWSCTSAPFWWACRTRCLPELSVPRACAGWRQGSWQGGGFRQLSGCRAAQVPLIVGGGGGGGGWELQGMWSDSSWALLQVGLGVTTQSSDWCPPPPSSPCERGRPCASCLCPCLERWW